MSVSHNHIRPLAVAIIRHNGKILVSPGYDPVKNESFYRLLGGGIDFGEKSVDALHREFQEELAAELAEPRLLGVLENIFTFNGKQGHEVCFLYEAEFRDQSFYDRSDLKVLDSADDDGRVIWLELDGENNKRIYPAGVADHL